MASKKRHVYGHGLYIVCSFYMLVEQTGERNWRLYSCCLVHCILWARVTCFRMDQWATIRGWPQVRGHGERSTRHVYNWTLHHNNKKTLRHSVPTLPNGAICYAENVHFLKCLRLFAKVAYELRRTRLSVRPSARNSAVPTEIWYQGLIWTSVEKFQIILQSDKKIGHCIWRSKHLFIIPAT